jgi:hypothetical protein
MLKWLKMVICKDGNLQLGSEEKMIRRHLKY